MLFMASSLPLTNWPLITDENKIGRRFQLQQTWLAAGVQVPGDKYVFQVKWQLTPGVEGTEEYLADRIKMPQTWTATTEPQKTKRRFLVTLLMW